MMTRSRSPIQLRFMKRVIQRDLRLPVAHCLTLFNVAETYHDAQFTPSVPGSFYRDPFSDMIPRERIYEIWAQEPLIKVGTTQKTRSQCIADYSDVVKKQVAALRNVVWKFGADMAGRFNFAARPLSIGVPFNFQNMSEDGRLWYGWAFWRNHAASWSCGERGQPSLKSWRPITAFFASLSCSAPKQTAIWSTRFAPARGIASLGSRIFSGAAGRSIAGFLDLRVRDLLNAAPLQQVPIQDQNRKMADIFSGALVAFDRAALTARVTLSTFRDADDIRDVLVNNGAVDISTDVSLVSTTGPKMADRVRDCLRAIGRPAIAAAAPPTYAALGHVPGQNPPRNDAVTPVSRILWDAPALAVEDTGLTDDTIQAAVQAVAATAWPLNQFQEAAIVHCLSHRLSIVWGPPGTGKTTTAAALVAARILAAIEMGRNIRILVTGPTYTAWEKLYGEILQLLERLQVTGLACYRSIPRPIRIEHPYRRRAITSKTSRPGSLDPGFQTLWGELQNPQRSYWLVLSSTSATASECRVPRVHSFLYLTSWSWTRVLRSTSAKRCSLSVCWRPTVEIVLFGDHLQMPPVIATQPPAWGRMAGRQHPGVFADHVINSRYKNLLINYRSAAAFVEFGKRIGYPPALSAYSEDLKLHRISPSGAKPADWRETVPWFPALNDILEPERRLVAVTYEDGKSGQANAFEADIVCSTVQELFLAFSQALDNEKDPTAKCCPGTCPIRCGPFLGSWCWNRHAASRTTCVNRSTAARNLSHTQPPKY